MKRIMGGKRYDTETSTKIHSGSGTTTDGFGEEVSVDETLYLSPNGQLFIFATLNDEYIG